MSPPPDYASRDSYDYLNTDTPLNMVHSERNEQKLEGHVDALDRRFHEAVKFSDDYTNKDSQWISDKKNVIRLNEGLEKKKQNFHTYSKSIETSKMLYNRERHNTLILSIVNVAALTGCAYMWLSQ